MPSENQSMLGEIQQEYLQSQLQSLYIDAIHLLLWILIRRRSTPKDRDAWSLSYLVQDIIRDQSLPERKGRQMSARGGYC
jgi:hypothetical protein